MPVLSFVAIYFLIWWLVLFVILPFGVTNQIETGERLAGTDPGAPVRTRIKLKLLVTTLLSFVLWGILYWIINATHLGLS